MAFTDDFNRADENLEASANWTRTGGSAGDCAVRSNKCAVITTFPSGAYYRSPDQGNANQYVQVANGTGAAAWGSFIAVRLNDNNNYIGMRALAASYEVQKCVAASFTSLGSYVTVPLTGDTMYLEGSGNAITFKLNGVTRIGPVTESAHNTITRAGIHPRAALNPIIDDYENGALGGGATLSVPVINRYPAGAGVIAGGIVR